jgi:pSer/pThr/pTyr-binding forkhead associated (FHA) protein
MSAVIVLVLRVLLAVCLYTFLFLAIFKIWGNTFNPAKRDFETQIPKILFKNIEDGKEHLPGKLEIFIGREIRNNIIVEDEAVSSTHARIYFKNENWLIEDLESTNGTFLNNQRIFTPSVLLNGDVISIGQTSLEISFSKKKPE